MPYRTEIKVRGYHLDFYGHVNNARYLEFLEEGRWRWIEAKADLGALLQEGLGFSVVNVNINYRQAALLGDLLVIESRVKKMGNRSVVVEQIVRNQATGSVVADADVTFVVVSIETGKALPIDDDFRRLLAD